MSDAKDSANNGAANNGAAHNGAVNDGAAGKEIPHDDHPHFGDELRLLAEAFLERVEPTLRRAAVGASREAWSSCDWCPVCAVTALVRGEHHDILGTLADHGTSVIVVLREALAGVPVEPRIPADLAKTTPSAKNGSEAPRTTARPEAVKFVNIPITINPTSSTKLHSNGDNPGSWAPVV